MAHAYSRLAARTGSLPGSTITRPVFGETVSSGIIDGDPTKDWVRVQGKCTPALDNLKFVNDEGKLTHLVGQPKEPHEVAMNKAPGLPDGFQLRRIPVQGGMYIYGCNVLGDC